MQFTHQKVQPHASIKPLVDHYYIFYGGSSQVIEDTFYASGSFEIVFNLGVKFHTFDGFKSAKFIGQIVDPLDTQFTGEGLSFGVVLHPLGAALLVNHKASQFNNCIVSLNDLLSSEIVNRVYTQLEQGDVAGAVQVFDDYFLSKLACPLLLGKPIGILNDSLETTQDLSAERGLVALVSRELNVSERYLQKIYRAYVGLTISQYRRVLRFNQVLQPLQNKGRDNLTFIAHAAGYYDQSHFIREVKRITSLTPSDLVKRSHLISSVYEG